MKDATLRCPARALCVLSNGLLCYASGPFLVILDKKYEAVFCEQILFSNAAIISGISQSKESTKLAIWGRRELCILTLTGEYSGVASAVRYADLAGSWILSCVFAEPGKLVVGLAEGGHFATLDQHALTKTPYPIEGNISCFDCSNSILAVGDICGQVAAFTLAGKLLWRNSGLLCTIRILDCGQFVIGCSADGEIRVWNDGSLVKRWDGHVNRIWGILPLHDSFVTFGEDAIAKRWSCNDFALKNQWKFADSGSILCAGINLSNLSFECDSLELPFGCSSPDLPFGCNLPDLFFGCFDGTIKRASLDSKESHQGMPGKFCSFSISSDEIILLNNSGICCNSAGQILHQSATLRQCRAIAKCNEDVLAIRSNGDLLMLSNGSLQIIQQRVFCLFGRFAYSLVDSFIYDIYQDRTILLPRVTILTSLLTLDDLLICGTRCGKILSIDSENGSILEQIQVSTDAVSSICSFGDSILAACKDGNIYKFVANDSWLNLVTFYKTQAHAARSGVEWVAAWGEIVLFAYFFGKALVVKYGLLPRCNFLTLAEWPCGGNHRAWRCHISKNALSFGYLVDGTFVLQTAPLGGCAGSLALERGRWHSKIVRAAAPLGHGCFVTGSDDGSVALWRENVLLQRLDHFHRSCICCTTSCGGYIFSGGGRSEIVAFRFLPPGELVYASRYSHTDAEDLRVMAVCSALQSPGSVRLIFSLSNGSVLQGLYDTVGNEFVRSSMRNLLNLEANCYASCISCSSAFVLLALSNGSLVVWAHGKILLTQRLHNGAITSLCLDKCCAYTGGYDGQLLKTELRGVDEAKNGNDFQLSTRHLHSFLFPVFGMCRTGKGTAVLTGDGTLSVVEDGLKIAQSKQTAIRDATGILAPNESLLVFGGNGVQSFGLDELGL